MKVYTASNHVLLSGDKALRVKAGSTEWGEIGGVLSNQTDLQERLVNIETSMPKVSYSMSEPTDGSVFWVSTVEEVV